MNNTWAKYQWQNDINTCNNVWILKIIDLPKSMTLNDKLTLFSIFCMAEIGIAPEMYIYNKAFIAVCLLKLRETNKRNYKEKENIFSPHFFVRTARDKSSRSQRKGNAILMSYTQHDVNQWCSSAPPKVSGRWFMSSFWMSFIPVIVLALLSLKYVSGWMPSRSRVTLI